MCSWVKNVIKMCLRVHVQRQKAHNSAVRLRGCVFDDRLVLPTGLKGEPLPLDASLVMKLAKGSTCPVSSFTFPSSGTINRVIV